MKKFLWLIILIPIFMTRTFASETYYSEYSNFSEYQEEYIKESDTVDVDEVTMYKWYKETKKAGDYKLYNSYDKFTDDCYETQYSNWDTLKPQMTEATILEERIIYDYQVIRPIRYIHLYNLDGSYSSFRITELQVFYDNTEINYTYSCVGCWKDFDKFIHNGIYEENMSIIDDNGSLIIDLGKEYPIDKIKLVIYLFDIGYEDKKYTIGFSNDGKNYLVNKSYSQQFTLFYAKDSIRYEYSLADFNVNNDIWLYPYTSQQYLDNDFVYSRTSYNEYRYKQKLCRTYTIEKDYYPQYSINSINDYNLKDSPKKFYRYRTRDKLQLNTYDITEKNYDLNNFVIFSSDSYTINHNINWDKNDAYDITFNLNDINVTKSVKLNVLSNAIIEKEEEINNLKEQLNNTIEDYQRIVSELDKSNKEYLNALNELNNQIIELNDRIEKLNSENIIQDEYINNLKTELELKITEHRKKIEELERLNKIYLENINVLLNGISDLEGRLTNLEGYNHDTNQQILELKTKLEDHIEQYDITIIQQEDFNNNCLLELENINLNIKIINEYMQKIQLDNDNKNEDLNNKIQDNTNYIINIKNILNNYMNNFYEIDLEIENIKEQINQNELANNYLYEDITSQLEETKHDMSDSIANLNLQIDNIKSIIIELNKKDENSEKNIAELYEKLEKSINDYKIDLEELNKSDVYFSGKLNEYNKQLQTFKQSLYIITNNEIENNSSIESIKEEIDKSKMQYNNLTNNFEEFIQKCLNSYKDIDYEFKNIFSEILSIKKVSDEILSKFNEEINENSLLLKAIQSNTDEYINAINNQSSLINKFNEYEQYISKIQLLYDEIKEFIKEVNDINKLNNNQYDKIDDFQKIIYDELNKINNEISNIKENQIVDNDKFKSLKSDILYVSSKLDGTNEPKNSSLNWKLNDYILKINDVEVVNLLWIYIVITIIFAFYLIYLFKKSRIKK